MACQRFADDLRAHAAGADATPDLRAHLERCDNCRAALARKQRVIVGIDRDLADALRVEPSVEFQARVRQRINEDQGSGFSRIVGSVPRWRLALGAASLVVVAAVVTTIALRTGTSRPQVPPHAAPSASTQALVAPVERQQTPVSRAAPGSVAAAAEHRTARHRPTSNTVVREPEVLVPPDQRVAIGRLLEMIRAGKIDERTFLPTAQEDVAGAPARVVAPIVVEELKVPPINVAAAGGTEKRN